MSQAPRTPSAAIWPSLLDHLLVSPQLKQQLLPEGLLTSPYRVLDYNATLFLGDKTGASAVFQRTQQIQFEQDGVEAILDTFWGDGVQLIQYHHSAGTVDASFRDAERRYLLIKLKHKAAKGEQLTFTVERQAMETFLGAEEWVEATLTHQVARLRRRIVFPKGRPCRAASLHHEGIARPLPIVQLPRGRTSVQFEITSPGIGSPYRIHWTW